MRAPAAPACLSRSTFARPRRRRPRSRRAGSRARRRGGRRGRAGRRAQRGHDRVDPRVLGEHVADAAVQRRRQPAGRVLGRVAQRRNAQRLAGRATFGPALVVARARVDVLVARGRDDQRPPVQLERHGLDREVPAVQAQGLALGAEERGELVEQARSGRRPSRSPRASTAARGRGGRGRVGWWSPASAISARASAVESAAEDDRPLPRGRSPAMRSRAPPTSWPAARSSPTVPRTNARQPSQSRGGAWRRRRPSRRGRRRGPRSARPPAPRRAPSRPARWRTAGTARRCSRCARR